MVAEYVNACTGRRPKPAAGRRGRLRPSEGTWRPGTTGPGRLAAGPGGPCGLGGRLGGPADRQYPAGERLRGLARTLTPEDVFVEVAYGRAEESDGSRTSRWPNSRPREDLGKGRHLFSGTLVIDRSGSFGYTVRVLPKHDGPRLEGRIGLIVKPRGRR